MISRRGFLRGLASVAAGVAIQIPLKRSNREPNLKVVCDESQIVNFVSVSFDGIEYSNGFWFRDGSVYYTEPAFDKESIRKYGMRMKFVYGGPLTQEEANALRDVYLAELAYPVYSIERQ